MATRKLTRANFKKVYDRFMLFWDHQKNGFNPKEYFNHYTFENYLNRKGYWIVGPDWPLWAYNGLLEEYIVKNWIDISKNWDVLFSQPIPGQPIE